MGTVICGSYFNFTINKSLDRWHFTAPSFPVETGYWLQTVYIGFQDTWGFLKAFTTSIRALSVPHINAESIFIPSPMLDRLVMPAAVPAPQNCLTTDDGA